MKTKSLWCVVWSVAFLSSCYQPEKEQLKDEIDRLQKESTLRKRDNFYVDSLLMVLNFALDSMNSQQYILDTILSSPKYKRENILLKINQLDNFIKRNQALIQQLESRLKTEKNQQDFQIQGLLLLMGNLKKDLNLKEEKIKFLETKVNNLQADVSNLQQEVLEYETNLKKQVQTNQENTQRLTSTQDALQNAELEKINAEIKRFLIEGEANEKLGDKYSKLTNATKKWAQYQQAFDNYKAALDLYVSYPKASTFLSYSKSEIENKMRTVKEKIPEKVRNKMKI